MLATAGYVEQRDERAAKRAALGLEQLLQTSTGSTSTEKTCSHRNLNLLHQLFQDIHLDVEK